MADGRITLTDVMRGIRKHGLIDRMSEECFTFLIGLILEANEIGFKNPIGLTVSQALPIGGGHNRQTLNGRRKSLAKVKIDGKHLVEIKAGNKGKNSVATYKIDYISLCSYNGVWQGIEVLPSNKLDNSPANSATRHPTSEPHLGLQLPYHPKIRSEEKREEQTPPNPPNKVTTSPGQENENGDGVVSFSVDDSELSETDQFIKLLQEKFKLPSSPVYGMVNNMVFKYTLEACVAAMESSKPTSNTWQGILAYIAKVAANISAQSRGVSGEKLDNMEKAYRDLYYELEESQAAVDRDRDTMDAKALKEAESWLDRSESQLAMMRHTIEENGGSLEVRR